MADDDDEQIGIYIPEPAIGFAAGACSASLISTTTASEVMKVLATEAACSKQHLTTCLTKINLVYRWNARAEKA